MQEPRDEALAATLGQRLDDLGRQVAARHLVTYAWAAGVAPALGRAARQSELFHGRFARDETPAARPLLTGLPAKGRVPEPGPGGLRLADSAGPATPDEGAEPLPAGVRARLREAAGPGADMMLVHAGPAADQVARAHQADAVTEGADVYLRDGQLDADEPAGFALLAHEAAHVTALLDPAMAARRAGGGGPAAEEQMALGAEQAALPLAVPPGPAGRPAAAQLARPVRAAAAVPRPGGEAAGPATAIAQAGPPAAAAAHPMRAAQDREYAQAPPFDLDELRRGLITELMRQLRTEFERGG